MLKSSLHFVLMIHAVYIIDRNGIPLYFWEKVSSSSDITRATLFSGVILAIQSLLKDMRIGEATEVSTKAYDVLFEVAINFAIVVVVDPSEGRNKEALKEKLSKFTVSVSFELKDIVDGNLNDEESEKLNLITSRFIDECDQIFKSSDATKRLRESLW